MSFSNCFVGFAIDILNFVDLVHLAKVTDNMLQKLLGPPADIDPDKVIILSHGWRYIELIGLGPDQVSEHLGPNYPLIRTLQRVATQKGWKVIVPDFRATYQYGHNRGRSERVRMIYSEILCLDPKVNNFFTAPDPSSPKLFYWSGTVKEALLHRLLAKTGKRRMHAH